MKIKIEDFVSGCCEGSQPWIRRNAKYGIRRMIKILWMGKSVWMNFSPITNFTTVTQILSQKADASINMRLLHKDIRVLFQKHLDAIVACGGSRNVKPAEGELEAVLKLIDIYRIEDQFAD